MRLPVPFALALVLAAALPAAELGHPGGPEPENLDPFFAELSRDPYAVELLLSFGTSKGGSAGHLALSLKGRAPGGDDLVWSANFYADRKPEHAQGYYNRELMCAIPRKEYLYKTRSTLGPDASFGLDFGEVYKRAVVGVRIRGLAAGDVDKLDAFCRRLNRDFAARAKKTDYHGREIVYDYMDLNCAKTIAVAFKYGLGWRDVSVRGEGLSGLHFIKALKANVPSSTLQEIMEAAARRGHAMDVILYKKFQGSTYVNPRDEGRTPYQDLPNRFPSVLSTDYKMEQGRYEDYDNLYAMHLLYGLGRASVVFDGATRRLHFEARKEPSSWAEATRVADDKAEDESKLVLRRLLFRAWGIRLGDGTDNDDLYGAPQGRGGAGYDGLIGPE